MKMKAVGRSKRSLRERKAKQRWRLCSVGRILRTKNTRHTICREIGISPFFVVFSLTTNGDLSLTFCICNIHPNDNYYRTNYLIHCKCFMKNNCSCNYRYNCCYSYKRRCPVNANLHNCHIR